jgi:DNA-binding MarR family transcriptional regulator
MPEQNPPDFEQVQAVAVALRRAVTSLVRRLRAERAPHGVSSSKLSVLGRLARQGALTATKLAEEERIQPQSLTRLLAELEQGALITRREDEFDKRQLLIEITPAGLELLVKDAHQQTVWLAKAIPTVLSPIETQLVWLSAHLLQRLADADASIEPQIETTGEQT